jgi:hypothetical protein
MRMCGLQRARRDNEYKRCGTANVFCAVEPKAGRHFTFPTPDRSAPEFAPVAFHLALQYPEAETIHLVMDNLNIHHRKSMTDFYGAEVGTEIWDCFTVHYTPKHGSWLNQAEIEIGMFSRQCLGKRRIPDPNSCDPHGLAMHEGKLISCDAGIHPGWSDNESPSAGWIFQIDFI